MHQTNYLVGAGGHARSSSVDILVTGQQHFIGHEVSSREQHNVDVSGWCRQQGNCPATLLAVIKWSISKCDDYITYTIDLETSRT